MGETGERGPGPSLDLPPESEAAAELRASGGLGSEALGAEASEPPEEELPPVPTPLAVELGSRVPDWAPIAAVVLLVVLGVVALAMRVF